MTEFEIISWIFLATAIGSEKEQIDVNGISEIADGINHAIPNQNELKNSLLWLMKNRLLKIFRNKYSLTESGIEMYSSASKRTNTLIEIWKILETEIRTMPNNAYKK